jgi:DNA primase
MSSDKTIPKYINSPETEVYVKNKTLYGAFQAKKAIRQQDECILVEGYMDVISLHQAGIENAVASSGTSLTEGQLHLIKRNTNNLKIIYDGDPAGCKSCALRGSILALEQDMNVKICLLPDGHDPDSYVQQMGGEEFLKFVSANAKDFILFKAQLLLSETQGDPIKKAGLVKDIVASIAKIPDPIKRSVYLKECSSLLDVSEQALIGESNKLITGTIKKREERVARQPGSASDSPDVSPDPHFPVAEPEFASPGRDKPMSRGDEFQERDIVRLLVQYGNQALEKEGVSVAEYILSDIEESLGNFDNPLYGKIAAQCHDLLVQGAGFNQHYFLQHEMQEIRDLTIDLLTEKDSMSPNWVDMWNFPLQNQPMPDLNFDSDMKQALERFKLRKIQKMCELNLNRVKTASESGDMDAMMRFMKIQQKLNETRNEIARRVGTVVMPK